MNRTIVPVASVRVGNNFDRRGVSVGLAAIAVGIAVPVALLRAADEKPGAPVPQQESPQPKGKEAQSLFKVWQEGARTNGNIPGGALGSLARVAANFVKFNPTDERAPKLAELLKRMAQWGTLKTGRTHASARGWRRRRGTQ